MLKQLIFILLGFYFISTAANAVEKPNIVLILTDDMGYSDIGSYGGEISTPNLDTLAKNGIRFTQMHNASKCFPSRASLLTGLYAQQNGFHSHYSAFQNSVTIGEVLKSVGYRTLLSGKHHSRESLYDRGFDRVFGLLDGATNHFNPGVKRIGEVAPAKKTIKGRGWNIDGKLYKPYTPKDRNFYSTDSYTNYALEYLEEYKNEDKPFLLYLAYTAPHDPLQAWPEDIAKYAETYKVGYEKIRQARYAKMQKEGVVDHHSPLSAPTYQSWQGLTKRQQDIEARKMAVYAAMIDRLDQNVGRVIDKLKALGKFENTLIIFASDNGGSAQNAEKAGNKEVQLVEDGNDINLIGTVGYWASLKSDWANVSNTPFRFHKTSSFSGGTNTPFIVHWPKKIRATAGSINSSYTGHFIDLMPTLIDITGAKYPRSYNDTVVLPMAGESFLPQLMGSEKPRAKPLFWQFRQHKAVLYRHWKAINDDGNWQLFNMKSDRTEIQNLATHYPEQLATLIQMYRDWFLSTPAGKESSAH
ncbi:arylsulfatase [Thalassotalea sp. PLHSN55]|uniref:arylsulfatase n=1 Tax=Thalassotalea sp. PLHSN55 TaxID=3435888 RepID=UPI003F852130